MAKTHLHCISIRKRCISTFSSGEEYAIAISDSTATKEMTVSAAHESCASFFCDCRLPDNGSRMVQCARCLKWYHIKCVVEDENELKIGFVHVKILLLLYIYS